MAATFILLSRLGETFKLRSSSLYPYSTLGCTLQPATARNATTSSARGRCTCRELSEHSEAQCVTNGWHNGQGHPLVTTACLAFSSWRTCISPQLQSHARVHKNLRVLRHYRLVLLQIKDGEMGRACGTYERHNNFRGKSKRKTTTIKPLK
jgi:hypothetical protein